MHGTKERHDDDPEGAVLALRKIATSYGRAREAETFSRMQIILAWLAALGSPSIPFAIGGYLKSPNPCDLLSLVVACVGVMVGIGLLGSMITRRRIMQRWRDSLIVAGIDLQTGRHGIPSPLATPSDERDRCAMPEKPTDSTASTEPNASGTDLTEKTSQRIGVHMGHCCSRHGCKYCDADCPVTNRRSPQEFLCEFCEDDPDPRIVLMLEATAEIRKDDIPQFVLAATDNDLDDGEYVQLPSWYANGTHPVLRPLAGRRLRITVQLIDDCPRCTTLPLDIAPAVSRVDNRTRICSSCGIDESLRHRDDQHLPTLDEWPVTDRYTAALPATDRLIHQTDKD